MRTVPQMGWAGSTNGELLRRASASGFDALITVDRGFEFQQDSNSLPMAVVIAIAARSRLQDLQHLVAGIVAVLSKDLQHRIYKVSS